MGDYVLSPLGYPNPVLHVDCDAFFTSVEQALNPALRGKPVITGSERGIVACASYEAKRLGIRRPMKLYDAKKEHPELIALESDYETYSLFSLRLFSILRRFTPVVEPFSMDEAFAELSGLRRLFRKDFPQIARDVKQTVQKELGLTVSCGLSASKTLAKMASQSQKPDGFTLWPANQLHELLKKVKVIEIPGIGANTSALLQKFGVYTAHDYVGRPLSWIGKLLGKIGLELWHELRGECVYPVQTSAERPRASIQRVRTFTPSGDKNILLAEWRENLDAAMRKLRLHHLKAKTFFLLARDEHFQSQGVEVKLAKPTSSTRETALLLENFFARLIERNKKYRQTGVVLSHLSEENQNQYDLFEDRQAVEKMTRLDRAVDEIFRTHGPQALFPANRLFLKKVRAPARLRLPFWKILV